MQRYKESTKQRNYFFHPASMQIQPNPVVRNRRAGLLFVPYDNYSSYSYRTSIFPSIPPLGIIWVLLTG